jgi:hypothetical protein
MDIRIRWGDRLVLEGEEAVDIGQGLSDFKALDYLVAINDNSTTPPRNGHRRIHPRLPYRLFQASYQKIL